ncbi:MAG: hypothetical protein VKL42_22945 [Snowella sp.]|nr:hypothetical protein [Snowella sp.]
MRPLRVAVQRFQEREDYRERCFNNLRMDNAKIPLVIDGIDLLAVDWNLNSTERSFNERYNEFY